MEGSRKRQGHFDFHALLHSNMFSFAYFIACLEAGTWSPSKWICALDMETKLKSCMYTQAPGAIWQFFVSQGCFIDTFIQITKEKQKG